ncbi:MAG: YraN family protein [Coriobacteriia bacterium]|nr:YraN family protein [Coriobacteriia bacterium]
MTTEITAETLETRSQTMAEHFLNEKGYRIVERDWCIKQGSSGLVAEDDDTLVFIQVLSRESDDGKLPEEKPARRSRASFELSAAKYLSRNNRQSSRVRFDIISLLLLGKNQAFLRHHIDALSSDIE